MTRPVLRFQLLFLVLLGVLIGVARAPFVLETLRDPLCAGLAWAVSGLLHALGTANSVSESVVRGGGGAIQVVYDCDGVGLMCFFLAAALAFPVSRWRVALPGIAVGLLVIMLANLLRLTGLAWMVLHDWGAFEIAHAYFFQGFIVLVTLATWLGWARVVRRAGSHVAAHPASAT